MPTTLLLAWLVAAPAPPVGPTVYTVDLSHSLLDFTTTLIGLNRVRGSFDRWSADFAWDPDHPEASVVAFTAEVASIHTNEPERDQHLQTPDFFDAVRFPLIRFRSTTVRATTAGLDVDGDLTIHDVTRRIRLPVVLLFPEQRDPFGNRRIVFGSRITLSRRDFGINGPAFWGRAIADSFTVELELAGRVWNFHDRQYGEGAKIGPRLVGAADSGRFNSVAVDVARELRAMDSVTAPRATEIQVAAGRLIEQGMSDEARRVLEMSLETAGRYWSAAAQSALETDLAGILYRLGRRNEAAPRIRTALTRNPDNTRALVWQSLLGAGK